MEIIAVGSDNNRKPINTINVQNTELLIAKQCKSKAVPQHTYGGAGGEEV
jgi:hypothetical protein